MCPYVTVYTHIILRLWVQTKADYKLKLSNFLVVPYSTKDKKGICLTERALDCTIVNIGSCVLKQDKYYNMHAHVGVYTHTNIHTNTEA